MRRSPREIRNKLKEEEFVVGALIALIDNDVKLDKKDKTVLPELAKIYKKNNSLKSSQISLIRNKIKKYTEELSKIDFEPLNNLRAKESKNEKIRKVSVYDSERIKIEFPFTQRDHAKVKSLAGRQFIQDGKNNYWIANWTVTNVEALKAAGYRLDKELEDWLGQCKTIDEQEVDIEGLDTLNAELYPFQKQAVSFMEEKGGNALVADSQGLGKTLETLAYLHLHPELRPALIVCPASLKLNWEREAEKFMGDVDVEILYGKQTFPINADNDLIIINYDILYDWIREIRKAKPKVLIVDESHKIKNDSKRTKATFQVSKGIKKVIALTGTPFLNKPIEIYNTIKLVNPRIFPSKWKFKTNYCDPKHNGFAWEYKGATNTQELNNILNKELMIRRRKEDVLPELPDKRDIVIPTEINNRKEYSKAENDFINYLQEIDPEKAKRAKKSEAFTKITALKQLALQGKIKNALDWIENFLEQNDKLVVFGFHKETINEIMKRFKNIAVKIDGSVSQKNRQDAIDKFQNDENTRLFVGNLDAASEGITLTAASDVLMLELPWSPGALEQATDRIHRIGQEADSVNVYYYVAEKTIEEKLLNTLDRKGEMFRKVIDGKEESDDTKAVLSDLIDSYSKGGKL